VFNITALMAVSFIFWGIMEYTEKAIEKLQITVPQWESNTQLE
jgi:hypothetical protein